MLRLCILGDDMFQVICNDNAKYFLNFSQIKFYISFFGVELRIAEFICEKVKYFLYYT